MMASQIFKFSISQKQKSRYLENETLFFLLIKKIINYASRASFIVKNNSLAKVSFKSIQRTSVIYLTCTVDTFSCVVTMVIVIIFNDFDFYSLSCKQIL